jgi:hypothetical protein
VCSFSGVAISGGDEIDSSTQVPAVKCSWVHMAPSYRDKHLMSSFPEVPTLVVPTWYPKPPGEAVGSPRASQAREEAKQADWWRNPVRP